MQRSDPEIAAVFPSRELAAEAAYELVALGLADEYLERAVSGAGHRAYEDDVDRAVFRSVGIGVAIGLVVGCIVGAILMYAGQLAAGVTPSWSSAIAAGLGGSLAGIFFGAVFGAAAKSRLFEQSDPWSAVPLDGEQMLVVTHGHGWDGSVRQILSDHGGRPLDRPASRAA